MRLQDRLDAYKKSFIAKAPKEALETMHRATAALAGAGLVEKAASVGSRAPVFSLKDTAAQTVALTDLLKRGPVVLAFYRGKW